MKFFIDTANLDEIRDAKAMGVLDGVTTNPSLMKQAGRKDTDALLKEICDVVQGPVSGEVTALDAEGMIAEGKRLAKISEHIVVKIPTTLEGLRARAGNGRLIALVEPRSNTMRMGDHRAQLATSTAAADLVFWFQPPGMNWSLESVVEQSTAPARLVGSIDELVQAVAVEAMPGDQVVIMSNGSFGGIHQKLLDQLARAEKHE